MLILIAVGLQIRPSGVVDWHGLHA